MTILQQVLLAFAAFVLFIFAIRLVFALLLRLQLLPILVWLGVGRLYPQWAAAHPFVFYGVLALFALLALSCWLRPVVEWVQEQQMLRMAERRIKDDLHRANAGCFRMSYFLSSTGSSPRTSRIQRSLSSALTSSGVISSRPVC